MGRRTGEHLQKVGTLKRKSGWVTGSPAKRGNLPHGLFKPLTGFGGNFMWLLHTVTWPL